MRRYGLRHGVKYLLCTASVGLVLALSQSGIEVIRHPLHADRYAILDASIRDGDLWQLIQRDDFKFLATVVFLTTTGAHTWPTPADWNNAANSVECPGGGGGGGSGGAGGCGGGYAKTTNLTLAGTINFYCGEAGVGGVNGGASATDGGFSWFNGTGVGDASVYASGGGNGDTGTGTPGAGVTGSTLHTGGNNGSVITFDYGAGGGGAAGTAADGSDGGNGDSGSAALSGAGGNAGATNGGAGGTGVTNITGHNGSTGTAFDASHGPGGGGSGGGFASGGIVRNGGNGANYGGAGGGGSFADDFSGIGNGGNGGQGLIVITYTPVAGTVIKTRMIPQTMGGTIGGFFG